MIKKQFGSLKISQYLNKKLKSYNWSHVTPDVLNLEHQKKKKN